MLQNQAKHQLLLSRMLSGMLLVVLIATVASVPTSVLAQDSELSMLADKLNKSMASNNSSNNGANAKPGAMLNKVKRSSDDTENTAETAVLNKKSSPEIVPASYNPPPPRKSTVDMQPLIANEPLLLTPTENDRFLNSAVAAGLTVAAAAAIANNLSNKNAQSNSDEQLYGSRQYYEEQPEVVVPAYMHKRALVGAQPHYLYQGGNNILESTNPELYLNGAYADAAEPNYVPNGVWSDDTDPALVFNDLQNEYYPKVYSARYNKPYDNLQNILNTEAYLDGPLPLPYANRFDENKHFSLNKLNKYDMRLKRDNKLSPADMLALVALVEAGERARSDSEAYDIAKGNSVYGGAYDAAIQQQQQQFNDELQYNGAGGAWLEPETLPDNADYYGLPLTMETLPKYELPRKHAKYANRYSAKRFMVAKKKRSGSGSWGKFYNEPVAKPSMAYF